MLAHYIKTQETSAAWYSARSWGGVWQQGLECASPAWRPQAGLGGARTDKGAFGEWVKNLEKEKEKMREDEKVRKRGEKEERTT